MNRNLWPILLLSTACNTSILSEENPKPWIVEEDKNFDAAPDIFSTQKFAFGEYIPFLNTERGYGRPAEIGCQNEYGNSGGAPFYLKLTKAFYLDGELSFPEYPNSAYISYPVCDGVQMSKEDYINIYHYKAYVKFKGFSKNLWMMLEVDTNNIPNQTSSWNVDLSVFDSNMTDHRVIVKTDLNTISFHFYRNSCSRVSDDELNYFLEKIGEIEIIYENTINKKLYQPNLTKQPALYKKVPISNNVPNDQKTSLVLVTYSNDLFLSCYKPL